jgi:hypothetical protein
MEYTVAACFKGGCYEKYLLVMRDSPPLKSLPFYRIPGAIDCRWCIVELPTYNGLLLCLAHLEVMNSLCYPVLADILAGEELYSMC